MWSMKRGLMISVLVLCTFEAFRILGEPSFDLSTSEGVAYNLNRFLIGGVCGGLLWGCVVVSIQNYFYRKRTGAP
jgi:hypothetical protein